MTPAGMHTKQLCVGRKSIRFLCEKTKDCIRLYCKRIYWEKIRFITRISSYIITECIINKHISYMILGFINIHFNCYIYVNIFQNNFIYFIISLMLSTLHFFGIVITN